MSSLAERFDWYEPHQQWLADRSQGKKAYLREADLRGAKGFHVVAWTDHGYLVCATQCDDTWRIVAGCHDFFSLDEAIAHWSSPDYHTPSSGRRVVAGLRWLQEELKR